jgi:hypothetical protein
LTEVIKAQIIRDRQYFFFLDEMILSQVSFNSPVLEHSMAAPGPSLNRWRSIAAAKFGASAQGRRRQDRSARPHFEQLEDRVVLTAEVEPNGTIAAATASAVANDTLTGAIAIANDVDYFSLSLTQGSSLRVVLGTDPGQLHYAPRAEIVDAAGNVKAVSADGRDLKFLAQAAATYYVRVSSSQAFGMFTGAYSFPTTITTYSGVTEAEANNTPATANPLSSSSNFRGVLATATDIDYFSFTGSAGQAVAVKLADAPAANPSVRLFNNTGTLLASDLTGVGLHAALPASGAYTIALQSDNSAGVVTGSYGGALVVNTSPVLEAAAANDFTGAPVWNVTSTNSRAVGTLASLGDVDYFLVNFTAGNFYDFTLQSPAGGLAVQNRVMSLFNEYGQLLEYSTTGSLTSSSGTPRMEYAGRHFVTVQATSETGLGGYALQGRITQTYPTQRDVPLYYQDFTGVTAHLSYGPATPFAQQADVPLLGGLFEARYDIYDVDLTTTNPETGEYVNFGMGEFGTIGAYGYGSGGYGTRRPSGGSMVDETGASWGSLANMAYAEAAMNHEMGHAVGLSHARHPESFMAYDRQGDLNVVGAYYPFAWTDSRVPDVQMQNDREYLDWILQAGRIAPEIEPNDTGGGQNVAGYLAEMTADGVGRNDRVMVAGRISTAVDVDLYTFNATAGQTFAIDVDAAELQYPLNAALRLYDASGNLLATSLEALDRDSGLASTDPYLTYQFPTAGSYRVQISGENNSVGNYRLKWTANQAFETAGPRVLAAWPNGGSSPDSTRQLIFWFNDQLDPATLTASNIIVNGPDGVVAGTATFDPLDATLTWIANAKLDTGAHTVTFKSGAAGIKDLRGNALDGETTGSLSWPNISGNGAAGGDFVTSFTISSPDNTAAAVSSSNYYAHPYNRGLFRLYFTDELNAISVNSASWALHGAGADKVFNNADDSFAPLDVLYDKMLATGGTGTPLSLYARGIPDPGQYRTEASFLDAAGNAVNVAALVTVALAVPATALGTTAAMTESGLTGSYVNTSLRTYATQNDWRTSQTISGTRVDAPIAFRTGTWGARDAVGITGGTDADWENYSVQWDGFIRITTAGTRLSTSSDDGSRMWIDINNDGVFGASGSEFVNNHWGAGQATTQGPSSVSLAPGVYRIRIQYEEGNGGNEMFLNWDDPGGQRIVAHGPAVADLNFQPGTTLKGLPSSIQVTFSANINPATLTTATFDVRYSADPTFFDGNDTLLSEADGAIGWDAVNHRATFQPASPLANGYYLIELDGDAGGIADPAGSLLDGNYLDSNIAGNSTFSIWRDSPSGDGIAGGDYRAYFSIDAVPLTMIARTPDAGAILTTHGVNVDVVFSKSVVGVDFSDLVLTGPAAANATVGAPVNVGGNTWRFPVAGLVSGALIVNLAADADDIEDADGGDLSPLTWSYTVALDVVAPVVLSINRTTPAGPATDATSVVFTVAFSESVSSVDASDFALALNGVTTAPPLVVAGSGASYTVQIDGIAGNGTLGLNLVDDGSIRDAGGNRLSTADGAAPFAKQVTFATGPVPGSVALADFNGDGVVDLAAANEFGYSVSILLGNGDGTFREHLTFTGGIDGESLTAADLNGDGKPDLAVVNPFDDSVSVLLGNGNGTFQTERLFPTGPQSGIWHALVVADLNSDGKPDLATVDSVNDLVSVLLGNGNGTFQTGQTFAAGEPSAMVVGDFNGDGKRDLAVSNDSDSVSILLGNGNGTFQARVTFDAGFAPSSLVVGDLNSDGAADLAISEFSQVNVFLGNGNATFQAQQTFETGGYLLDAMALGDVNGDGRLDMAVVDRQERKLSVLLGNGDGLFHGQRAFATGQLPTAVAVGDLNADGKPDIVVANTFGDSLSVYLSTGKGDFVGQTYTISHPAVLTTTTLTANPNASTGGMLVTFTATVAPSPGNLGTVTFKDNSVPLTGAINLVSGVAIFQTSGLSAGPHLISADFSGADGYSASTSNKLNYVVTSEAPRVLSVTPNGNLASLAGPQRSRVASLVVAFDRAVQLNADAMTLALHTNNVVFGGVVQPAGMGALPANLEVNTTDNITYTVTFSGAGTVETGADAVSSLLDGVYGLTIAGAKVHPLGDPSVRMVGDLTTTFHRLFGDVDPPETTNGVDFAAVVNTGDNFAFRSAFNRPAPDYQAMLDFDGSGMINTGDNLAFRDRFNKTLTWKV